MYVKPINGGICNEEMLPSIMRTILQRVIRNVIILALLLAGCEAEKKGPRVETLDARDITDISAVCRGRVLDTETGVVSEFGIELDGGEGYVKHSRNKLVDGEFDVKLTDLTPGTTYRYRAYIEAGDIAYGSEELFTTLPALTFMAAIDPDKITSSSAVVSFSNTHRLKEWGVYYSESEATLNDPVKKEFSKPEITLTDLQPKSTYFILPYVKDKNNQITYLEKASFVTKNVLSGIRGTYAFSSRLANGRLNISKLINELNELNANTYNWLIWKGENDWDDLQLFLPIAKKNNINVWVTIVPYSESKPIANWSSEPYQTDYVKWAEEIAKLGLEYPNLKALSIDDFSGWNMQYYTVEYTSEFVTAMRNINPLLAFVPCIYYNSTKLTDYTAYLPYIDGVLFPYKAESSGKETLSRSDLLENEIKWMRSKFKGLPLIVDVYSSAHSKAGSSTPDYVSEVIRISKEHADGVLIYIHPDPVRDVEKYTIIKEEFSK